MRTTSLVSPANALAAAALIFGGCGAEAGSGLATPTAATAKPTSANTVPKDACALLTTAEASTVIGEQVTATSELAIRTADGLDLAQCKWRVSGQAKGEIVVAVVAGHERYEERKTLEGAEAVDELGDAAVIVDHASERLADPPRAPSGTVVGDRAAYVKRGERTLIVDLNVFGTPPGRTIMDFIPNSRLVALTKLALGRLDKAPVKDRAASLNRKETLVSCLKAAEIEPIYVGDDSNQEGVVFQVAGRAYLIDVFESPAGAKHSADFWGQAPDPYVGTAAIGSLSARYGDDLSSAEKASLDGCLRAQRGQP